MDKNIPKYKTIKKFLLNQIKSNKFKQDEKLPSEKELMNRFSVSRITVRKALDELAVEGYIYRLQGIGAFVKRSIAKIDNSSKLIGVLVTPISDFLSVGILKGIEKNLDRLGYHPVVQFSTGDVNDEANKLKKLKKLGVQGFIIMPHETLLGNNVIRNLTKSEVPIVFVDRTIDGLEGYSVESDNKKGGYDLTTHLVKKHGCRKIAFVTWEGLNVSSVRNRYMGALQSAKQNNAQVELVVSSKGRLQELTTKLVAYDAVFACTDLIAVELAVNLEVAGVKVPDDLKIVGFDDRPFSRLAYPSLTTARQFPERIGEKASSILVSIIKGNHISKKKSLFLLKS